MGFGTRVKLAAMTKLLRKLALAVAVVSGLVAAITSGREGRDRYDV